MNKNELLKTPTAIRFNLRGVCPSLSSFIFASLFINSFNFLSGYLTFYSTWWPVPALF